MNTCRRVAEMTAEEMDAQLPLLAQLSARFHRLYCSACRRHRHQLRLIDQQTRNYFLCIEEEMIAIPMSNDTKQRIRNRLILEIPENSDS